MNRNMRVEAELSKSMDGPLSAYIITNKRIVPFSVFALFVWDSLVVLIMTLD